MTPTHEYTCERCGTTQLTFLSIMDAVPAKVVSPCCEGAEASKVWAVPHIGKVVGAGGSPAR